MTKTLSILLALAVLGSAALTSAPALARSYKHGHPGWNAHAQNHSYRRHNYSRNYSYGRAYGLNTYPRRGTYYGSPYNYGSGPGFSIYIR